MNLTTEQLAEMSQRIAAHNFYLSQIRQAKNTDNVRSQYHPDRIWQRINSEISALDEALSI